MPRLRRRRVVESVRIFRADRYSEEMDLDQFWYYTGWHEYANRQTYEAPADPRKLLPVSPERVRYYTGELPLNWGLGRVRGGEWDREEHCGVIREMRVFTGLRQRFEEEYDWEETDLFQWAEERFEERDAVRGYESLAEYRQVRCEYLDDLYDSIRTDGYRPNERSGHEMASEENPFETAYANHLEPLVVIARDGEIYWTEGYHRFAIASLLGLDEIPVYVLCRHQQWQRVRDRIAETPQSDLSPELAAQLDHPDLQNL
jgi:hypothetical protein